MSFKRLEELEQRLLQARAVAEAAAERANRTKRQEDYDAALARAAEVDEIWQEYGALWRKLNPPAA